MNEYADDVVVATDDNNDDTSNRADDVGDDNMYNDVDVDHGHDDDIQ